MKRRDLLKALPGVALSHIALNGQEAGAALEINPRRKVVFFINENVLPVSSSLENRLKNLPKYEVIICPIRVPEGQKI